MKLVIPIIIARIGAEELALQRAHGPDPERSIAEVKESLELERRHLALSIENVLATVNDPSRSTPDDFTCAMRELAYFTGWMSLRQLKRGS